MRIDARHPAPSTLALLSGGDLPFLAALQARWHLRSCEKCTREFEAFRLARVELKPDSATDDQSVECDPAWNALEAEMRANIRLGLTAGSLASGSLPEGAREDGTAAVIPVPYAPWRWAAVGGAVVFVVIAGWSLRAPGGVPVVSAPVQQTSFAEPTGQDAKIQLLVPVADVSRTETDFDGSTRSRVIDSETGQVTLQQVYVE